MPNAKGTPRSTRPAGSRGGAARRRAAATAVLAALLARASGLAGAAPPVLEQQFSANCTETQAVDGVPIRNLTNSFRFHFDVPGQRWRVEQENKDGSNTTQIYRLLDRISYNIQTSAAGVVQVCAILPVFPGAVQPPVVIDHSAVDLGPSTAGGQPAELWEAHVPATARHAAYVADTWVQAKPAAGRHPMGLIFNTTQQYVESTVKTKAQWRPSRFRVVRPTHAPMANPTKS